MSLLGTDEIAQIEARVNQLTAEHYEGYWPGAYGEDVPRLLADRDALASALREVLDSEEDDLSACPYFARWESVEGHDPEATCSYGCVDEPACVTGEPTGGWPRMRALGILHGIAITAGA